MKSWTRKVFSRLRREWPIAATSVVAWAGLMSQAGPGGLIGICAQGGWIDVSAAHLKFAAGPQPLHACIVMSGAMTLAMMLPLVAANIRFVRLKSFPWRQQRAVAAFLAAFLGLWWGASLAMAVAEMSWRLDARPSEAVTAAAFLFAAIWQTTPAKRWALRACHATAPLYPLGLKADAACITYGARIALACAVSCAPMMFAAMTTSSSTPALAAVFAIAIFERYVWRPSVRASAAGLALAAALFGMQALLT